VAFIDGQPLTIDELISPDLYRATSNAAPSGNAKDLVEKAIRFEVLAKEARDRGYDTHPSVIRAAKQEMVSRMLRDNVQLNAADIPDSQIQQYYSGHLDEFRRPDRLHLRAVFVRSAPRAREVLAAAKALSPTDPGGFGDLARRYSEDEISRRNGGDFGLIQPASPIMPRTVIDAAFATSEGTVGGPVATDGGFYVLQVTERTKGYTRELYQVRELIHQRLVSTVEAKKLDDWTASVRQKHQVRIDDDRLKELDLSALSTNSP
jgi:parvulin-like peptidyl-prolyl isomerase